MEFAADGNKGTIAIEESYKRELSLFHLKNERKQSIPVKERLPQKNAINNKTMGKDKSNGVRPAKIELKVSHLKNCRKNCVKRRL